MSSSVSSEKMGTVRRSSRSSMCASAPDASRQPLRSGSDEARESVDHAAACSPDTARQGSNAPAGLKSMSPAATTRAAE